MKWTFCWILLLAGVVFANPAPVHREVLTDKSCCLHGKWRLAWNNFALFDIKFLADGTFECGNGNLSKVKYKGNWKYNPYGRKLTVEEYAVGTNDLQSVWEVILSDDYGDIRGKGYVRSQGSRNSQPIFVKFTRKK